MYVVQDSITSTTLLHPSSHTNLHVGASESEKFINKSVQFNKAADNNKVFSKQNVIEVRPDHLLIQNQVVRDALLLNSAQANAHNFRRKKRHIPETEVIRNMSNKTFLINKDWNLFSDSYISFKRFSSALLKRHENNNALNSPKKSKRSVMEMNHRNTFQSNKHFKTSIYNKQPKTLSVDNHVQFTTHSSTFSTTSHSDSTTSSIFSLLSSDKFDKNTLPSMKSNLSNTTFIPTTITRLTLNTQTTTLSSSTSTKQTFTSEILTSKTHTNLSKLTNTFTVTTPISDLKQTTIDNFNYTRQSSPSNSINITKDTTDSKTPLTLSNLKTKNTEKNIRAKIQNTDIDKDVFAVYLKSLYHSTMVLTTVGNLPEPTTKFGFAFAIFEFVFALLLFAAILGHVANIVTSISAARKEFQGIHMPINQ